MIRAPFRLLPPAFAPAFPPVPAFLPAVAFAATLALSLSGCASAAYPSLAIRPAERITGTAQPVTPEPVPTTAPIPPSASVTARAAQLVAQAEAAHRRFDGRRAETQRLVGAARGAAMASEAWSVATIAVSGLESARSDAMIALAELDGLYARESITAEGGSAPAETPANVAALFAARDQVTGLVGQEDAVLAGLRGALRN